MKRFITFALVLVAGAFCLFASTDYYIKSYDVQVTVGTNAVHHITETIDVYFEGSHHGIVREIPLDYSDYNGTVAKVQNLECSEDYSSDEDNGYLVLQIGSSRRTVIGDVRYIIEYDYDLGADYNEGYDLFYLNIIGPDWECDIKNVSFDIELPFVESEQFSSVQTFFDYVLENTRFSSGRYGSTGSSVDAYLVEESDHLLIEGTASGLGAYEAVTIKTDLPDNWYSGARTLWDHRAPMRVIAIIVSIILVALAGLVWMTRGRDTEPIIVARFEPPEGFSPLLVGYLADYNVDDKDVISMLFYWADQGLLSIEEKKGGKYEFTKLKDIEAYAIESHRNIPDFEAKLFNGFFKNCSVGKKVKFSDLQKNNFYKTIQETRTSTSRYFTGEKALIEKGTKGTAGLFALLSLVPMVLLTLAVGLRENVSELVFFHFGVGFLLFFINVASMSFLFERWHMRRTNFFALLFRLIIPVLAAFVLLLIERGMNGSASVLLTVICVASCTLTAMFGEIIQKRSDYGNRMLEAVLGYREFIDKVEVDKLKMMIQSDPDLYYRVLSYAVVLGLESKWAKKFDGMIVNEPTWYSGYDVFDVYLMSRLASNMIRTIPAASVPKSNISGSPGSRVGGGGFGGGGFSGGGFGGGGGHAW